MKYIICISGKDGQGCCIVDVGANFWGGSARSQQSAQNFDCKIVVDKGPCRVCIAIHTISTDVLIATQIAIRQNFVLAHLHDNLITIAKMTENGASVVASGFVQLFGRLRTMLGIYLMRQPLQFP
jgi:hypothetical protein